MTPEEKIFKVMKKIKEKIQISPKDSEISYRAGEELFGLTPEEEIRILNKLNDEGVIKINYNSSSDYI